MVEIGSFAVTSSYDDIADVLYVRVGPKQRTRCREDEKGIVWRVQENGDPAGATVQCFRGNWSGHRSQLVNLLADRLHISADALRKSIPA